MLFKLLTSNQRNLQKDTRLVREALIQHSPSWSYLCIVSQGIFTSHVERVL